MGQFNTESLNPSSRGLDLRAPKEIGAALFRGQLEATAAVETAMPEIVEAAAIAASTLQSGGRLIYAAAGSSGLMAMADALELPGTFGIDRDRVAILFAGGTPSLQTFFGGPEDDAAQAMREFDANGLTSGDCLICISASGSTPYALAVLEKAVDSGVTTIGIANNADSPVLRKAHIPILLPTPPELVAGSTRMGAGTAQKVALNILSTLMAFHLGHVVDGQMINVVADNTKLRDRAARIVANIGGCDHAAALTCLDRSDGAVKPAILLAAGVADVETARRILDGTNQNVRSALTALDQGNGPERQRA